MCVVSILFGGHRTHMQHLKNDYDLLIGELPNPVTNHPSGARRTAETLDFLAVTGNCNRDFLKVLHIAPTWPFGPRRKP